MLISVDPDQVTMGMYVHGFKRSSFSHPFWRARITIEGADLLFHTGQRYLEAQDVSLSENLRGDQVIGRKDAAHWPLTPWQTLQDALLTGTYRSPHTGSVRAA